MKKAIVRWGSKKAIMAEYGEHYASLDGKWYVIGETADGETITPEGFRTKAGAREDAHLTARDFDADVLFVG